MRFWCCHAQLFQQFTPKLKSLFDEEFHGCNQPYGKLFRFYARNSGVIKLAMGENLLNYQGDFIKGLYSTYSPVRYSRVNFLLLL